MLTCRELIGFLGRYIDGELSPEEGDEFEGHLAVCPSCRSYLESYRQTIALGKEALSATDQAPPESVPEDLVKAILAARKKGR